MHRGVETPWCPMYRGVETPRCPMYQGVKTLKYFVSQNCETVPLNHGMYYAMVLLWFCLFMTSIKALTYEAVLIQW